MYETEIKELPVTHKNRYMVVIRLGDVHVDTHYANTYGTAENIAKFYQSHPMKYTEVHANVAA